LRYTTHATTHSLCFCCIHGIDFDYMTARPEWESLVNVSANVCHNLNTINIVANKRMDFYSVIVVFFDSLIIIMHSLHLSIVFLIVADNLLFPKTKFPCPSGWTLVLSWFYRFLIRIAAIKQTEKNCL